MIEISTDTKWLREMAEKEDNCPISVGGLMVKLAARERQERSPELAAVRKLLELRRELGLSVDDLTRQAHVAEADLSDLEGGLKMPSSRDVVALVGRALGLPGERLLAAAGLGGGADPELRSAALRCADLAKVPARLSPAEDKALRAFKEALTVK